jgi:beta-barrel assembly-enhancing protease
MKKITAIAFTIVFILLTRCSPVQAEDILQHLDTITRAATVTQKAARPISDEEEYYVGRAVAARILSIYPLARDEYLNAYINLIGSSIVIHSDKPYTHGGYHFAVLNTHEKNAFACPGGIIFITKGILGATRNEDELAAVLAHEIAHITHRDGIAAIQKSRWTEALTVIGADAMKQYGSQEIARLVSLFEGSIDDVFKTLVVNGYGRLQENGADETATVLLFRAGYNPAALKDFLTRINREGGAQESGILKTHPSTIDRIENVSSHTSSMKTDQSLFQKRTGRFNKVLQYSK